jgi:phenylalanyl-tRNA synthetase beta chain
VDPDVAAEWDLEGRVIVAELDLVPIMPTGTRPFVALSPYPPVVFDLAFDLPEAAPAAELIEVVSDGAGANLERAVIFDVFRGPPLGEGRKSIALRLTLRSADRTLTDDELVPIRSKITDAVAQRLDGSLRGG